MPASFFYTFHKIIVIFNKPNSELLSIIKTKHMKKLNLILLLFLVASTSILFSFKNTEKTQSSPLIPGNDIVIPENVQLIIDNSCFGCHNMDAKSDKAKDKLLFDKLNDLSKAKLVAKLDGIAVTVEEGEMPPEKFLAKNPEKALSKEEAAAIINWANQTADKLLESN